MTEIVAYGRGSRHSLHACMLIGLKVGRFTGTASSSALDAIARLTTVLRPAHGVLRIKRDARKFFHAFQHRQTHQPKQVVSESGHGRTPGGSQRLLCDEQLRQQARMCWLLRDAFASTSILRRDRILAAIHGFGGAQRDIRFKCLSRAALCPLTIDSRAMATRKLKASSVSELEASELQGLTKQY